MTTAVRRPFRREAPARIVRSYGRDSLLVVLNPLATALEAGLGLRIGLRSDAEVRDRMEKDALTMEARGYRVVSADEFSLPAVAVSRARANWYRVTYELDQRRASSARPPNEPAAR